MTRLRPVGRPNIGLVQFPGSNCDQDVIDAMARHFDIPVTKVWHTETTLPKLDAVVLPGGFSFGDYLRSGALASHSPVMASVAQFAKAGGPVIGICNGFQVLTESRLLPGALLRNAGRHFICRFVHLQSTEGPSPSQQALKGKVLKIPIAHGEGRYWIDPDGLRRLQDQGQIAFRYVTADGSATDAANPNGSVASIAGVVSENGRVLGMMPHPERATDELLGGSKDGLAILEGFLATAL